MIFKVPHAFPFKLQNVPEIISSVVTDILEFAILELVFFLSLNWEIQPPSHPICEQPPVGSLLDRDS